MAKDNSKKMTKKEKSWIMYDWANSVYATNIMAAIFPIYFAAVCRGNGIDGDIWWGYGTSIATAVVAILAPLLGAVGDYKGAKKKFFTAFLILGVIFTFTMAIFDSWQGLLVGYVLSYIGYAGANVFYDSFLTDVTTDDRMDRISSWGYAMGYIGGSTIPFLISIAVLLVMGMSNPVAVKISVIITSVWWLVFSIPMLRNVHQEHYIEGKGSVKKAFGNIISTLKDIFKNKSVYIFLIAYFFYIDGVNTVIHMATSYGSTIGLDTTGMILALLVTQIVAVPFSLFFSSIAKKIGSIRMISIAICIYFVICCVGFYMGASLEPKQADYESGYNAVCKTVSAENADFNNKASYELYNEVLNGKGIEKGLVESGFAILPYSGRAEEFKEISDELLNEYKPKFEKISLSDAKTFEKEFSAVSETLYAYVSDTAKSAPYDKAIEFSSMLFWAMAVLVGTVQGGIQALSRSYFGKLIPPERSNEYFGIFDIFGKFACIMGPALYAFVHDMTGKPSMGILSLILLFAIGFIIIVTNKKHLLNK